MNRLWLILLCLATLQARALQVTDDRGIAVTLARPPQRVVTLLPSLTEAVCELGACARLVGVDNFSNWPPQVRALPRVGGLEDASIEMIVALKPDVVFLSATSRTIGRLESLGVKVIAIEVKTLADVRRVLGTIGQAIGVGGAARVWERLDAGVDAAARTLPAGLRGTTVYFEINNAPVAASESSFIGELLARVGAANVVPGRLGPYPKLNPELVVRADPQVIMVADRHARALDNRPGWDRIRAVREGRVCMFTADQADVLVRPGPRMAEAVQLMVECLQGRLKGKA
jgi:iron complex transport system substrate-binding protein